MSSPESSPLQPDQNKNSIDPTRMKAGRVVIVTGLSGAGKSTALKSLEDLGFYCIDNLPFFLLNTLLRESARREAAPHQFAIGMDVRNEEFLASFSRFFVGLSKRHPAELLFLEADDDVLIRRYSEVRRKHPLDSTEGLRGAIVCERRLLQSVRTAAWQVLDTSHLTIHDLRKRVWAIYGGENAGRSFSVTFLSFGFKYGIPLEADLVFDARFLPNPYFIPALKARSGLEPDVAAYAIDNALGREFLDRLSALLNFLIPQYRREGKMGLTVAIGCTGGRHRSVAIAHELARRLSQEGAVFTAQHRDANRH